MTAAAAFVNLEDFDLHAIDQLLSELNKLGRTIVHRKQGHRMSPIGNHIKRSDNATNTDEVRRPVKTRNNGSLGKNKTQEISFNMVYLGDSSFFYHGYSQMTGHERVPCPESHAQALHSQICSSAHFAWQVLSYDKVCRCLEYVSATKGREDLGELERDQRNRGIYEELHRGRICGKQGH